MKLRIPYVFAAHVILNRGRSAKGELFLSSVDVDLPEVEEADAPVVLKVTQPGMLGHADEQVDYRHYDGNFYVPSRLPGRLAEIVSPTRRHESLTRLFEVFQPSVLRLPGQLEPLIAAWMANPPQHQDELMGPEIRHMGESRQAEARAAVLDSLGAAILLDGRAWRRIDEPRFVLGMESDYSRAHIVHQRFDEGRDREHSGQIPNAAAYFSPNDIDALNLALASGLSGRRFEQDFEIDVIDPSVFDFDRTGDLARRIATHFSYGDVQALPGRSREFLLDWCDVRELLKGEMDLSAQEEVARLVEKRLPDLGETPYGATLARMVAVWQSAAASMAPNPQSEPGSPRVP